MEKTMKPQSLEARIAFLREAQGLLEQERAAIDAVAFLEPESKEEEAAEAHISQTLQDQARKLSLKYAPLLRGTPEEAYLERFVANYKLHIGVVSDIKLEDIKKEFIEDTYNALYAAGLTYLGKVREQGEKGLLKINGIGRKGLREVTTVFSRLGLPLDGKKYVTPEQRAQALETKLDMTFYDFVDKYNLSIRAQNCLMNLGIKRVGEIVVYSKKELREKLKGFGDQCSNEVEKLLGREGLYYGMIKTYIPPEQRTEK